SPLPVNQADVATMMSLTVRFIPLILDESDEVKDAAKARCVGERGRVRRTVAYSYPLLLRVLRRADELAVAMSSRCYTGARRAEFSAGRRDALALAVVASVALVSLGVTFL
ncbi:MAG: energy-coupling factor transporter transmembrane component T, partial [Halobacteria archaeon]|nr:energy-coupling factor transporter transmembrane component T [Halobacteria archaeon]